MIIDKLSVNVLKTYDLEAIDLKASRRSAK